MDSENSMKKPLAQWSVPTSGGLFHIGDEEMLMLAQELEVDRPVAGTGRRAGIVMRNLLLALTKRELIRSQHELRRTCLYEQVEADLLFPLSRQAVVAAAQEVFARMHPGEEWGDGKDPKQLRCVSLAKAAVRAALEAWEPSEEQMQAFVAAAAVTVTNDQVELEHVDAALAAATRTEIL